MELTTVWFCLIAVLWIGYFCLEGFDFGVGMLLPVLAGRRPRAPRPDQHDRPGVGRQRGVAARRRRRDLRGVPRVVRHPLQRLLPAAAADPGRADRARCRVRVPRQARRRRAGGRAGTWRSSSAPASRRCCGAWRSPTSCAACRSTRTGSTSAASSTCSTPTPCSAGRPRCCSSSPTARCSSPSRPTARSGTRPAASPPGSGWSPRRWPSRSSSGPSWTRATSAPRCSSSAAAAALVAGLVAVGAGARGLGLPRHVRGDRAGGRRACSSRSSPT